MSALTSILAAELIKIELKEKFSAAGAEKFRNSVLPII